MSGGAEGTQATGLGFLRHQKWVLQAAQVLLTANSWHACSPACQNTNGMPNRW